MNLDNIIDGTISGTISGLAVVSIIGLTSFFTIRNWKRATLFFKKQKLNFFPADFNLALSLCFEEGLNSGHYYKQIKNNLIHFIDDAGLSEQIILKEISDIKKFKNTREAEIFREQKKIDLIIWGDFTNDNLKKNGESLNETHLRFTFGHPKDDNNILGKMLLLDINSVIAQKNYWTIFENNSLEDVRIISANIFDIATYIMALTLKLYGKINESVLLFEQLQKRLISTKETNKTLYEKILMNLYNCYELLILEHGVYGSNDELAKQWCQKILAIKEFQKNFFAMANLAKALYCLGEKVEAEILVNKLETLYPDEPITLIDVAYFKILQGDFKGAFQKYKKLTKYNAVKFFPENVIEFLGIEYHKTKEPALLYGSGIIGNRWWDKQLAKKHLTIFVKNAKDSRYKLMRKEAEKILGKLKKTHNSNFL